MFQTAPATLDDLKAKISEEIKNISVQSPRKVISNLLWRTRTCRDAAEQHFQHLL